MKKKSLFPVLLVIFSLLTAMLGLGILVDVKVLPVQTAGRIIIFVITYLMFLGITIMAFVRERHLGRLSDEIETLTESHDDIKSQLSEAKRFHEDMANRDYTAADILPKSNQWKIIWNGSTALKTLGKETGYRDYEEDIEKFVIPNLFDEDREKFRRNMSSDNLLALFMDREMEFSVEYRMKNAGGSYSWRSAYVMLSEDATTGVLHAHLTIRDIDSERNAKEESDKLKDRLDKSYMLVNALADEYFNVYLVDLHRDEYHTIREKRLSPAGNVKSYSVMIKSLIESNMADSEREKLQETPVFDVSYIYKEFEEGKNKISFVFKDRFNSWYYLKVVPYVSENSTELSAVVAIRNFTDEIQREKFLEEQLGILRDNITMRNEFVLDSTRKMRTPMNVISGMVDISRNNSTDSHKIIECLEKMEESNRAIGHLVEKIQDMAYLEEEIILDELKAVNLKEVAEEAVVKIREELPEKSKVAHVEARINHPIVLTDERHLVRALGYIIREAIKEADVESRVVMCISENGMSDDGRILYEIVMDMPGRSTEETFDGRITISRAEMIIKALGGEMNLWVKEEDGGTVRITLPLYPGNANELQLDETDVDAVDFWGMQVLVAEDNALNMKVMEDLLKERGIAVTKAWNGQEVVEAFRSSEVDHFDLVILDIKMPVMDGYEAARSIRAMNREDSKEVIIFTVTADDNDESVKRVFESGIDRYFLKPVSVSEVLKEYIRMTE